MLHKGQVKSAFKWQVLNISLQAILQFAFIMISARVLPKEVHGAFAILNSFIFVLSITSEGGVSSAIIQRKEINKKHVSISFYITMALSLFMFLLIAGFAQPIANFYEEKVTAKELVWASMIFIFKALGSVSRAFLVRDFKFKKLFFANNTSFIIGNLIVVYVLSVLDYGIYALIFGYVSTQLIQSLMYFLFAKHTIKLQWGKEEFNHLFHFGSSFMLLKITNYLSAQTDKLLIGKYFDVTALSIYEKGQFISKMPPKYLGNTIDAIMFSSFSKMNSRQQKNKYFALIITGIMILAFFFAVFVHFNAGIMVKLILGKNWLDAIPFLEIFAWVIPPMILARLGDVIVRSENKMFYGVPVKVGFLAGIVAAIFILKEGELLVLTAAVVCVYWLHGISMLLLSWSILKSRIGNYSKALLIPIGVGVVFAIKYYLVGLLDFGEWITLGINLLLDGLLILGALYYFRKHPALQSLLKQIKNKLSKLKS